MFQTIHAGIQPVDAVSAFNSVAVLSTDAAYRIEVGRAAAQAGMHVAATAVDDEGDAAKLDGHRVIVLDPDALADTACGGPEALDDPEACVVLYGGPAGLAATRAGVRRVVDRKMGPEVLAMALRAVCAEAGRGESCPPTLSRRERQVIALYGRGLTLKEIGRKLRISGKSVETYKFRACQKLGLRGRAQVLCFVEPQLRRPAVPDGLMRH